VKKHRRWGRKPFARRLMLKMDAANYTLNYAILSLPFKRGERILIPLEYGEYQRSFLTDPSLKRGSVTLTDSAVLITLTKETRLAQPLGRTGVDLNERSVVCSDGLRYNLSEVARLPTEYGVRRGEFYKKHARDRRLKQKFAGESREKERVKQVLHRAAKEIVESAKSNVAAGYHVWVRFAQERRAQMKR